MVYLTFSCASSLPRGELIWPGYLSFIDIFTIAHEQNDRHVPTRTPTEPTQQTARTGQILKHWLETQHNTSTYPPSRLLRLSRSYCNNMEAYSLPHPASSCHFTSTSNPPLLTDCRCVVIRLRPSVRRFASLFPSLVEFIRVCWITNTLHFTAFVPFLCALHRQHHHGSSSCQRELNLPRHSSDRDTRKVRRALFCSDHAALSGCFPSCKLACTETISTLPVYKDPSGPGFEEIMACVRLFEACSNGDARTVRDLVDQ